MPPHCTTCLICLPDTFLLPFTDTFPPAAAVGFYFTVLQFFVISTTIPPHLESTHYTTLGGDYTRALPRPPHHLMMMMDINDDDDTGYYDTVNDERTDDDDYSVSCLIPVVK